MQKGVHDVFELLNTFVQKYMKKELLIKVIIFFMLLLFSIDFFNKAGYILALIIALFLATNKIKKINYTTINLIIFSLAYFINYSLNFGFTIQSLIIYLMAPWCSYLISNKIVEKSQLDKKLVHQFIGVLIIGFFLHGILNLFSYIQIYGTNYFRRISYDFWKKEIASVTGNGLLFTPICSFSIGYIFFGQKKSLKIISVLCIALSIYATIIYRNRTLILMLPILVLLCIALILFSKKEKFNNAQKIYIILGTIFFIVLFIYMKGMQWLESLDVIERVTSGQDTGRVQLWIVFLKKNPFKYIIGGSQFSLQGNWVHNMWLDVLYKVGIIPFINLVIFTIETIICSIRLWINNKDRYNNVIIIMFLGETINCMVEPVIDANPYIFIFFIMISGIIINTYRKEVKKNHKNTLEC